MPTVQTLAAVLLTGANHDGAAGLPQVKQRGGLTIVQDPDDAQVATMPQAALNIHAARPHSHPYTASAVCLSSWNESHAK